MYHEMKKRWAISHSCGSQIFQVWGVSICSWNGCLGYLSCLELPKSVIHRSIILAPTSLFIRLLPLNKSFHLTPSPVGWHGPCTPAEYINGVAAGSLVSVSHTKKSHLHLFVFYTPYSGMKKNNMKKWRLWEACICRDGLLMMSGFGNFWFFPEICVNATSICFRRTPKENVH